MADSMMRIWTERFEFWTVFSVWLMGTPLLLNYAFRAARLQAEGTQSRWRTPVGVASITVLFLVWIFPVALLLLPRGPASHGEFLFGAYVVSALTATLFSLALRGRARILAACAGLLNLIFIWMFALSK